MSFPRYPAYKDSGVEWLGEVPEHWEVCALRRIVSMQSGESITGETIDETGDFPVFGGNGLRGYTTDFTHDGHFVLIGRQGALCGNVNYASGKFWASEHAVVVTPVKQIQTFWLGEMLRAMNLNQYSVAAAQPGLSVDLVGRIGVCVPPLPEQTAIATFLDHETAKIDALVAEQRRLIELLKEKRQAVISHAVTRGLNPNAPMKPSGIEWLGDVPEHWKVSPLKKLARLQTGMTPPTDDWGNYAEENGYPWVRPEDLDETGAPAKASKFLTEKGWLQTRRINQGASLICCIGTIGKVGVVTETVSTNQQITAAQPTEDSRYLFYSICAARTELELTSTGNVLRILNTERLGNVQFPNPPLIEQAQIAMFLDSETAKLDVLTTEAQRAIDLLQERRTALISAAVTGQIDVRCAE